MPKKKETNLVEHEEKSALVKTGVLATGRGFEEMDSQDLIVPYVKIMQPLCPEVQDDDMDIKQGDLVNSLSLYNYGKKIKFIPLMFRKRRIKWIPRKEGGGMECASLNSISPDIGEMHTKQCLQCKYSNWTGNEPPECDLIYGFPAIILNTDQANKLVIVSFTRTSFGTGKKLINQMRFAGGDMFGRPYEVETKKETKKVGNTIHTYFILIAKPAGQLKGKEFEEAEIYYDMLQTTTIKYHEEETSIDNSDDLPF